MGNSSFAASMSANLTNFPFWRNSLGPPGDVPLLAEDLVFSPQPFQPGRDVLLSGAVRRID
jgi:hypothetical protein